MATKQETIISRYVGHCPTCNKKQDGRTESIADRLCGECKKAEHTKNVESRLKFLEGATIVGINVRCYLDYDETISGRSISQITVRLGDRLIEINTGQGVYKDIEGPFTGWIDGDVNTEGE